MDKFIPREKLGKKARKALDSQRRTTWSFSPITRKVESKKRYKRKTHECEDRNIVGFTVSLWGGIFDKVTVFKDALVFTLTSGEDVRV